MTIHEQRIAIDAPGVMPLSANSNSGHGASLRQALGKNAGKGTRGTTRALIVLLMLGAWCAPVGAEVATDESCATGYEGVESFATCEDGRLAVRPQPSGRQDSASVASSADKTPEAPSKEPEK